MWGKPSAALSALFLCFSLLGTAVAERSPAPLKVGILVPLSGNYAAVGEDNRQGFEAARMLTPEAQRFEYVYADSKADPAIALSEFRKLRDADAVAAVFAMRSPVGMALSPVARAAKVPLLGGVGHMDFARKNEFAFQLWARSDYEGAEIAKVLERHSLSEIAMVTTQDDWTSAVSEGLRVEGRKHGLKILFDQEVLPGETDFRTVISRIKERRPEVLFVNLGLAQIAPFLRQAREQHLEGIYYSNFFLAKKDVLEAAGADVLEGVRYVEMDTNLPILRRVIEERFGARVSGATLAAFTGALLVSQALAEAPEARTSQALYQALAKQHELKTPDRTFQIDERAVVFPMVERVIKSGVALDYPNR